jgi:FMN-dependent NADH-azoreductase
MNILHLDSSPLTQNSSSRRLSRAIVDEICRHFPQATITYRDLGRNPPAHLSEDTFLALIKGAASDAQTEREVAAIHRSIDELRRCDAVVIGAPMFNHSVTSQLKAWIDQVCQAKITFSFTSAGAVGLLEDKPVFIASTRGGIYATSAQREMDHQEPYLQATLRLMGLNNSHIIRAEGVDKNNPGRERSENNALNDIPALIQKVLL